MIFLHGFYHEETDARLSPLKGSERERERKRIYLINTSFPLPKIKKIINFENRVKLIKTRLSKKKNKKQKKNKFS
jgi:hypothetical protein